MTDALIVSCTIERHESGRLLLDLLTERFTYHDRGCWQQIIADNQIRLNGLCPRPDQVLRQGDRLTYHAVDHREPEIPSQIEVVFERPDLLLVGKPAGVPLQRTGQVIANTFVNQLCRRYNQAIYPLHRLDRETSGLLLCARGAEANRVCQRRREEIITGKYYLAVVKGCFPAQAQSVAQPLETRADSRIRCRMWPSESGKACLTHFYKIAGNKHRSLLLARLETGRRHQIRAHLACLGHPLVGDKIYDRDGGFYLKRLESPLTEEDFQQLGARNHTLHAWALRLDLPGDSRRLCFSRLFSADFKACLAEFPGWQERACACLQDLQSA